MTLAVLAGLAALATYFLIRKRRRAAAGAYSLSIIAFMAVGCGWVPMLLLHGLQDAYAAKPNIEFGQRNAIVLQGGGSESINAAEIVEPGMFSYGRIVQAAEVYGDCRKAAADCKIVVSGGDPQQTGRSEAAVYRDVLTRLGVTPADVLLETRSMNTWQNAEFTSAALLKTGPDKVLLVSSGIHLQRSLLYFAHFGVNAVPVRADYMSAMPSLVPIAFNFTASDAALHEYTGIVRYRLYNVLGWNPRRRQPGEA